MSSPAQQSGESRAIRLPVDYGEWRDSDLHADFPEMRGISRGGAETRRKINEGRREIARSARVAGILRSP